MFWHRFHRGDESFFNPPRCATIQQATGHCKRKEDLNTLSFHARRYKRSPFDQTLRYSSLAARRHNRSMFEANTHEADETGETDESQRTLVGTTLISPRYHGESVVDSLLPRSYGKTTIEWAVERVKSFCGVEQHGRVQRWKNFIFGVEHGESVYPPQTNTLRKQNRMTAATQPNHHDDFPSWKHPYYYYYRYHSDINTRSEYTERSSVISPRYQRSCREVVR